MPCAIIAHNGWFPSGGNRAISITDQLAGGEDALETNDGCAMQFYQ